MLNCRGVNIRAREDGIRCGYYDLHRLGYCLMMKPDNFAFVLLLLGLFAFIGASADEPRMPEITAQGFSADHPQNGIAGEYPRLRVRIEAIDRIKELTIKERSYEVDLALTKDKYNLQLFGLDQSPRSYPDVTLNLQKYINEKIDKEGQYEFHILVTDKSDNTVEKIISVHVHETKPATESDIGEDASLLQTDLFTLQRTGIETVKGTRLFDIDWKNTDNTTVTIRITKSENSNTRLRMLDKSDFDRMQTINQLAQRVADLEEVKAIVLTTASNKAAGEVFSISHDDKHYILKVVESSAYPSARGTIVTVKGSYKYQGIAE
jgi:hypothetical protein